MVDVVFTSQARKTLDDAAFRARYNYRAKSVQLPHFLWELTHCKGSVSVQVLENLGCNLVQIRKNLGQLIEEEEEHTPLPGTLRLSGLLLTVIDVAATEACPAHPGRVPVDNHHMLVGLIELMNTNSIILSVLDRYDLTVDIVRAEIAKVLAKQSAQKRTSSRFQKKRSKKKTAA